MKKILYIAVLFTLIWGCRKADIAHTLPYESNIPWSDSSYKHPKNEVFKNLLTKYNKMGLPGISLLVKDVNGAWCGVVGKSDLEKNMPFKVDQVSKIASISKLIIGATVFKMMEDSIRTGSGIQPFIKKSPPGFVPA